MPEEIELEPLIQGFKLPEGLPPNLDSSSENTDSNSWAWGTACIFILLALPLLLSPRLFLFLSSPASSEGETDLRTSLTPLETLFSVHLGLGLLALSLGLILGIPTSPSPSPTLMRTALAPRPPQHPLLVPVTLLTSLSSLISYNTAGIGSVGTVVSIVSGFVGLWGSYVILFGGESSISKTTGADKRTSRFIFGNKAAASAQKKAWKKERGTHDRSDS